jgi:hypothetical protein
MEFGSTHWIGADISSASLNRTAHTMPSKSGRVKILISVPPGVFFQYFEFKEYSNLENQNQ